MNLESLAEAGERLCGPDIGRDDTSATAHHRMGEVTQDGLEIVQVLIHLCLEIVQL